MRPFLRFGSGKTFEICCFSVAIAVAVVVDSAAPCDRDCSSLVMSGDAPSVDMDSPSVAERAFDPCIQKTNQSCSHLRHCYYQRSILGTCPHYLAGDQHQHMKDLQRILKHSLTTAFERKRAGWCRDWPWDLPSEEGMVVVASDSAPDRVALALLVLLMLQTRGTKVFW